MLRLRTPDAALRLAPLVLLLSTAAAAPRRGGGGGDYYSEEEEGGDDDGGFSLFGLSSGASYGILAAIVFIVLTIIYYVFKCIICKSLRQKKAKTTPGASAVPAAASNAAYAPVPQLQDHQQGVDTSYNAVQYPPQAQYAPYPQQQMGQVPIGQQTGQVPVGQQVVWMPQQHGDQQQQQWAAPPPQYQQYPQYNQGYNQGYYDPHAVQAKGVDGPTDVKYN